MTDPDPTTSTPTPSAPPPSAQAMPPPPPTSDSLPPIWRPPNQPPPWRPPPDDHGRNASLVVGLIFLVIGLWFFATRTLGLDLPRLDWGQLWPILLIGLGAWIVLGSVRRGR